MTISEYIKSSFTPYEIAVIGRFLNFLMFFAVLFFAYQSASASAFVIIIGTFSSLSLGCWILSRCPGCAKPVDREYIFNDQTFFGELERHFPIGRWQKLWPDRECSECRYELDLFPDQQRGGR